MKRIEELYNGRIHDIRLNTSYPLSPTDWIRYQTIGSLPFCEDEILSFYLHIPFCRQLCSFCEYTRMRCPSETAQRAYLETLENDIDKFLESHPNITLNGFDIGGGTPTSLTEGSFSRLLDIYWGVLERTSQTDDFEPSIEGTFQTVTQEKLRKIADAGIKRLSLGIQTSDRKILARHGRKDSDVDRMLAIMEEARKVGIQKINLDLMYGLDGQTVDAVIRDIQLLRQLSPEQITLYELRPNMLRYAISQTKEERYQAYAMYYDALTGLGYFAKFGQNTFSSEKDDLGLSSYLRHRMLACSPYRGFGISAQSMNALGICYNKYKNHPSQSIDLSGASYENETFYRLPSIELLNKYIAISAYYGGFSLKIASNMIGTDAEKYFQQEMDFCLSEGLVTKDNDTIRITPKGFFNYGAVFSLFYLRE